MIKITNNDLKLAKIILNMIIQDHNLLDLILTKKSLLFILKFRLLL